MQWNEHHWEVYPSIADAATSEAQAARFPGAPSEPMLMSENPAADKSHAILQQIEYYLSDKNLVHDKFFCNLLAENDGWVAIAPYLLSCNKIKALDTSAQEIEDALQHSSALEVDRASGRIRRKTPFKPHRDTGQDKGTGKGKVDKGKGKGSGHSESRAAPVYDRTGPCGYFIAGYCHRGNTCSVQHSIPYAEAIRNEWLHPDDSTMKEALRTAASELLGAREVSAAALFPRVFSQKLRCKPAQTETETDLADLGFQWGPDPGTVETSAQKPGRWARRKGAVSQEAAPAPPLSASGASPSPQGIRYFLVFDLEGKHEIIEFPVLLIDAVAGTEIGRFQRFVRPTKLFEGCPVTDTPAIPFPDVLAEFNSWLSEKTGRRLQDLAGRGMQDVAFVTCGDWDCKHIKTQCGICEVPFPRAFAQWINIKRTYSEAYGGEFRGMKSMLARLRLLDRDGNPRHGFHHLGMHDVENIARCLIHLLDSDVVLEINGWLPG
eukprot:s972_g3.t1